MEPSAFGDLSFFPCQTLGKTNVKTLQKLHTTLCRTRSKTPCNANPRKIPTKTKPRTAMVTAMKTTTMAVVMVVEAIFKVAAVLAAIMVAEAAATTTTTTTAITFYLSFARPQWPYNHTVLSHKPTKPTASSTRLWQCCSRKQLRKQ
jgi:hypothetical protein